MKKKLSLLMVALLGIVGLSTAAWRAASEPVTITWDFSEYTEAVPLIGESSQLEYNGLLLVGNPDQTDASKEFIKAGAGFHMNGTSGANRRYIKYTPEYDGKMTVTYRSNNTSATDRITAIGTEVAVFAQSNVNEGTVPETVVAYGFTDGSTNQTFTADLVAGKTYFVYFANGGQSIMKLEYTYTPASEEPVADPVKWTDYSFTSFNFNAANVLCSSGTSTDGDITEETGNLVIVDAETGVTLTTTPSGANTANRFWSTANGPQLRVYGGTMTFEAPAGKVINKLTFDNGKWNNGNAADAGTFEANVWTGSEPKVVVTIAGNTQLNKIDAEIADAPVVPATDIEVSPADGDIAAALAAASEGKLVKNITINLTKDVTYTVSAPIVAPNSVTINGNGATVDASALDKAFVQLSAEPTAAFLPKNDGSGDTDYYGVEKVNINGVKVTGLKSSIFFDNNKKYCVVDFTIDNSIFALATESVNNEALISFQAGGAKDFTVKNSTIYGNNAGAKYFLRYNNASRIDRYGFLGSDDTWSFTYENNTFYGLLKLKEDGTSDGQWGNYSGITSKKAQGIITVKNNIWVDCDAQTMRRMLNSQAFSVFNAASVMENNVFNFNGEILDQSNYGNGSDLAGVVTFTDAAAGDFNGIVKLGEGATAPETLGDPRWTLVYEETPAGPEKFYIMGQGTTNEWAGTTEMTFNAETNAFEYTLDVAETIYITFGDAEFTSWDDFNANHRYAYAAGDQTAVLDESVQLVKVEGTLVLEPGKYLVSVTKDLKCTIAKTGEATGISTVKADGLENVVIYNLRGQRVENATKGLYIVNGKKVVLK